MAATEVTKKLYQCDKCKAIYDVQHVAERCCEPYHCNMCGVETPKYRTRCRSCCDKAQFEKARKITLAEYKATHPDHPVVFGNDDYCFGDEFTIVDEAMDKGATFAWAAEEHPVRLDEEWAIQRLEEDAGCEDLEISDEGRNAYAVFVREWNEKYGTCVFVSDERVAVLMPEAAKEEPT